MKHIITCNNNDLDEQDRQIDNAIKYFEADGRQTVCNRQVFFRHNFFKDGGAIYIDETGESFNSICGNSIHEYLKQHPDSIEICLNPTLFNDNTLFEI